MNVQSPCTYGRSNDISYVHASDLHSVTCIIRCFVNGTLNDVQVVLSLLPVYFIIRPLSIDGLSEGTFVEPGFIQSILDWLLWQPMVGPILLIGTQSVFQVTGLLCAVPTQVHVAKPKLADLINPTLGGSRISNAIASVGVGVDIAATVYDICEDLSEVKGDKSIPWVGLAKLLVSAWRIDMCSTLVALGLWTLVRAGSWVSESDNRVKNILTTVLVRVGLVQLVDQANVGTEAKPKAEVRARNREKYCAMFAALTLVTNPWRLVNLLFFWIADRVNSVPASGDDRYRTYMRRLTMPVGMAMVLAMTRIVGGLDDGQQCSTSSEVAQFVSKIWHAGVARSAEVKCVLAEWSVVGTRLLVLAVGQLWRWLRPWDGFLKGLALVTSPLQVGFLYAAEKWWKIKEIMTGVVAERSVENCMLVNEQGAGMYHLETYKYEISWDSESQVMESIGVFMELPRYHVEVTDATPYILRVRDLDIVQAYEILRIWRAVVKDKDATLMDRVAIAVFGQVEYGTYDVEETVWEVPSKDKETKEVMVCVDCKMEVDKIKPDVAVSDFDVHPCARIQFCGQGTDTQAAVLRPCTAGQSYTGLLSRRVQVYCDTVESLRLARRALVSLHREPVAICMVGESKCDGAPTVLVRTTRHSLRELHLQYDRYVWSDNAMSQLLGTVLKMGDRFYRPGPGFGADTAKERMRALVVSMLNVTVQEKLPLVVRSQAVAFEEQKGVAGFLEATTVPPEGWINVLRQETRDYGFDSVQRRGDTLTINKFGADEFRAKRFVGRYERYPTRFSDTQPSRGFRKMHYLFRCLDQSKFTAASDIACGAGGFVAYLNSEFRGATIVAQTLAEPVKIDVETIARAGAGAGNKLYYAYNDLNSEASVLEVLKRTQKVGLIVCDAGERMPSLVDQSRWYEDHRIYGGVMRHCKATLAQGGSLILKTMGNFYPSVGFNELMAHFQRVRLVSEPESGGASAEVYWVAAGYMSQTVPVTHNLASLANQAVGAKRAMFVVRAACGEGSKGKLADPVLERGRTYNYIPATGPSMGPIWPHGAERYLGDHEFTYGEEKLVVRSHYARMKEKIFFALSRKFTLRDPVDSPLEHLPVIKVFDVLPKGREPTVRQVEFWRDPMAEATGIGKHTQVLASSIPTHKHVVAGLARMDYEEKRLDSRDLRNLMKAADALFPRGYPKAGQYNWEEVLERVNRKGALGVVEKLDYDKTLGELVQDEKFKQHVEAIEAGLRQGNYPVAWYNVMGKLEVKVRDNASDGGEWTAADVESYQKMRVLEGPMAVLGKLESDLIIPARVISFMDAAIRVVELRNLGPIEQAFEEGALEGHIYGLTPWEMNAARHGHHERLVRKYGACAEYAADCSKLDGRMGLMEHFLRKHVYLRSVTARQHKLVDYLLDVVMGAGRLIPEAGLYILAHNHGAGSYYTSKGHTICVLSMVVLSLSEVTKTSCAAVVKDHVDGRLRLWGCGDDHLVQCNEPLAVSLCEAAPEVFDRYGHVLRMGKQSGGVVVMDESLAFLGYQPDIIFVRGTKVVLTKRSVVNDASRFVISKSARLMSRDAVSDSLLASKAVSVMLMQPRSWLLTVLARITLAYTGKPTQLAAEDIRKLGKAAAAIDLKHFEKIPRRLWGVEWSDLGGGRGSDEDQQIWEWLQMAKVFPARKNFKKYYQRTAVRRELTHALLSAVRARWGEPKDASFLRDSKLLEGVADAMGFNVKRKAWW